MTHEEIACLIYVDVYQDFRADLDDRDRYIACCNQICHYMPGYSIADFTKIVDYIWELREIPEYDTE